MSTRMQGRLSVGPTPSPDATGEGVLLARQSATIGFDATLVQTATFNIPVGSNIVDVLFDVTTAYDSATSATAALGTASGGTTYAGSVNAKTAGRTRPSFSAAQVGALIGITSSTVVATVTSVGQPTAGAVRVTIIYEPAAN